MISQAKCPPEPRTKPAITTLPGLAFAAATRSFMDWILLSLLTTIRYGSFTSRAIQSKLSILYCFSVWLNAPICVLVTAPMV